MTRGLRTLRPMIADLEDTTIEEAVQAASLLWTGMNLLPGDASEMLTIAARIQNWASERGIVAIADLTGDTAAAMLRDLARVEQPTQFHKPRAAERLHRTRNTLIALRGTVLVARTNHASKRGNRPARDSLAAGLPLVADRTQQSRRPLRNDEVLLARLLIEIDLMENAPAVPMLAYLLAETGVAGMENTKAMRDHLDDPLAPRKVIASGLRKNGPRELKLDSYVANAMARILPTLRPGNQPLTYTGAKTGRDASASLTPVLTRHLARAGVTGGDISAKSVTLWRPDHLLRCGRLKQAVRVHGTRTTNLLGALRYTTDETSLHKKKIILVDQHGKTVAKVPSWHLRAA